MSTATIELSSTRRKLFDLLGDNQAQYLEHLKSWFKKKSSKEDFDSAARKLLSSESVHLHNQFLLAILNKCQTLVNLSPSQPGILKTASSNESSGQNNPELISPSKYESPTSGSERLKKGKIKRKSKPNRASLEHRFQAVSTPACAPEVGPSIPSAGGVSGVTSVSLREEERSVKFCAREGTLPDIALIHGRLMVGAWEEGLEEVEDQVVQLVLVAVEQQIRKLLTALLQTRNSWRVKEGLPYAMGRNSAPNPWLLNTQAKRRRTATEGACVSTTLNELGLAPTPREDIERAECEALYNSALSCSQGEERRPLDLFHLLSALQADRSILPSHSVYSLNVERVIMRLHHPVREDI